MHLRSHTPGSHPHHVLPFQARSPRHADHAPLRLLAARFDILTRPITIGTTTFTLHAVKDTNRLLDAIDPATFAVDERFPYWAELWPSALELAQWVTADTSMPGKRVLELGCGLGLAGIAAAKAGADVTMTDYEEDALLFAEANAATNLAPGECARVVLRYLDWRNPPAGERYDRVIGSDVVYERRNFAPILDLLRTILVPAGDALLTEPDRRIGEEFFAAAEAAGFAVTLDKIDRLTEDGTITVTRARLTNGREGAA